MKINEVILKAMSGEITWIQASQIIGIGPRSMRRWKCRYERNGYDGLLDRRTQRPSPKRAPFQEVQAVLRLYKERYDGFNVRHFHQMAVREHGITLSYSFVKKALQEAGMTRKAKSRGRHRLRRERKACFGEMLHIDGSTHAWLALCPDQKQTLIAIGDDATGRVLYAQLWPSESAYAVLSALKAVFAEHGLPLSLYSDRASWAFYTPQAGGKVDKTKLTQVGRALDALGVEHIPSYSPQARGRSERLNRTLQDRLINELRAAGITRVEDANRYLRERFIPMHNEFFSIPAREPESAFVSYGAHDLEQYLCEEHTRKVGQDKVVRIDNVMLQVAKQRDRSTCAGREVLVRKHLNGRLCVWLGAKLLGTFDCQGLPLSNTKRERKAA